MLLPPWDEYIVGYRAPGSRRRPSLERTPPSGSRRVGSSLVVIDGRVRGAWKITARTRAARLVQDYWTAMTSAEKRAVRDAALRYARFFGIELEA